MTLNGETFAKRFLLHVLPSGFYKIRYYGVLASTNSTQKKEQCLALIGKEQDLSPVEGLNAFEAFQILTGTDPYRCKKCGQGFMRIFPLPGAT